MNFIFFIAVIKAGLSKKNAEQVLAQLRFVIQSLTGNPNFPTTKPAVSELEQKEVELTNAIANAVYGGSNFIAIRNDVVGKVREMFTTLAADINEQSGGDETMALSSGLPLRAPKTPAGLLPEPANARGRAIGAGRIVLNWGVLKGRSAYRVYSNLDPNMQPQWELRGETSKNRMVVEGLTPGTLYYFRIAGVNNFGEGTFSDVVMLRAL